MEPPSVEKFIFKVEEAGRIYITLSQEEKTRAVQFLLSVVRRFTSVIKSGKGVELTDKIDDSFHDVLLTLQEQISKAVQLFEKSWCISTDAADSCDDLPEQQKCIISSLCQKTNCENQNAKNASENCSNGCGMAEDGENQENDSDEHHSEEFDLWTPNQREQSARNICLPFCSPKLSDDDLRQIKPVDKMERRQPIKLLVKKAYKNQRLGQNVDIPACKGTESVDRRDFSCSLCTSGFPQESEYLAHLVTDHHSSPCCCRVCGQLLASALLIKTHGSKDCSQLKSLSLRSPLSQGTSSLGKNDSIQDAADGECVKASESPHRFQCSICDKHFMRKKSLHIHHRQHRQGEKPFQCFECNSDFRTSKALTKHRQTNRHRLKEGLTVKEKKYTCSQCGKSYHRKQALQRHQKNHGEEAVPLQCQFCSFTAHETNNLRRHMDLHFEAKRNFMCEICGAAFHAKNTLETHIAFKHSDSRLFQCDQCPASFKVKNTLKRHQQVHSEEKSHKCWCGVGFKRLTNLRRHMVKLHGGTEGLLPPVRRVKTLDFSKKAPVSRTDLMVETTPDPSAEQPVGIMVPVNQDTSADYNSSIMVPVSQDTFQSSSNAITNVACCQSGLNVIHPLFQNQTSVTPVTQEGLFSGDSLRVSAVPQSTGLSSHVLRQIQEVFDLSRINME